ncbi:hypothetical protein LTR85_005625 [Meristemomyces frigidus]|nr:hypothetical protein LTR85_005625 [Meristemomyces frigidus]
MADSLAQAYKKVLNGIHLNNPMVPAIPAEVIAQILAYLGVGTVSQRQAAAGASISTTLSPHPALTPPRDGSSPFLALPSELRRAIFATSLSARDALVQPRCDDEHGTKKTAVRTTEPQANRTSDLMVLNKLICREIATVIYEEREFAIHVHEGIKNGGIEFLNAGRQPLQYKDDLRDQRFVKFRHGENFGFDRLKKIRIDIYPFDGPNRLVSMNTYYMNLALVALLDRSEGDDPKKPNRITSLRISFSSKRGNAAEQEGRRAIMNAEQYWWDGASHAPRATSIHGTSNIELVLLPFSRLRCHNVKINLPERLTSHAGTTAFVDRLVEAMTGTTLADMMDDHFQLLLEAGREAYDEHVLNTLFGDKKYHHVPKLSEADMQEEQDATKHDLSPISKGAAGDMKRCKSGAGPDACDEDGSDSLFDEYDFGMSGEDEKKELRMAIARSLRTQQRVRYVDPPTLGSFSGHGRVLGNARQPPQGHFAGTGRTLRSSAVWRDDSMAPRAARRLQGTSTVHRYAVTLLDGANDVDDEDDEPEADERHLFA